MFTTRSMIAVRLAERAGVMTRPRSAVVVGESPVAFTTWGVGSVPPFTIAQYAVASWRSVTAIPWPNAPFARSICFHGCTAGSRARPGTSPATSMPVRAPKPRRVLQERALRRVALGQEHLRAATEQVLPAALDPVLAGPVAVDEPEQLRGEGRAGGTPHQRVDSDRLRLQADLHERP